MLENGENKEVIIFTFCPFPFSRETTAICITDCSSNFYAQYLPIEGLATFNKATAELLLGADNPAIKEQRVCHRIGKYRFLNGKIRFFFSFL